MSSPRKSKLKQFTQSLSIGFFLAVREVRQANKWTTALIVTVMVLTFLNLIVISGILVGLIEGSENSAREYGSGDVVVSAFLNKSNIEHTPEIVDIVKTYPGYKSHTVRYIASARVSSDYRSTIKEGDICNSWRNINPNRF